MIRRTESDEYMPFAAEHRARGWGALLGLLAAILLIVGARRSHTIYDKGAMEFGMEDTVRISEWQLNRDATFSGVESSESRDLLLGVYDRSAPRGKQACPT